MKESKIRTASNGELENRIEQLEKNVLLLGTALGLTKQRIFLFGNETCFSWDLMSATELKDNFQKFKIRTKSDNYEFVTETKLIRRSK